MLYFLNTIIVTILTLFDLTVLPRLIHLELPPILTIPFLVILSLRDRTIFPVILAAVSGIIYDAASGDSSFVFTLVFVSTVLIAKLFFGAIQNYSYRRSLVLLTLGAASLSLAGSYQAILASYSRITLYWEIIEYLILTLLILGIYAKLGSRYFDYIEKTTAEMFR